MNRDLTFATSSGLIDVSGLSWGWVEMGLFYSKLLFPRRTPADPDDLDASTELGNIAHQITVCVEPPGSEVVMKLRTGQNLENGLSPGALYGYFPTDGSPPKYSTEKSELWSTEKIVICPLEINLTRKGLLRWEKVTDIFGSDRWYKSFWQRSSNFSDGTGSFDPFSLSDLQNQWTLAMVLIMLLFAYGGVHLFAWNFGFPSSQERLLWRIAGLYLVGTGALGTCVFFARDSIDHFLNAIDPRWRNAYISRYSLRARPASYVGSYCFDGFSWFADVLLILLALGYVYSRLYIVLESFLSVRHLPIGVYAAVPWANYIPHF